MEHESDDDTSYNWCARYNHQRIGTGTDGLGNKRTSGNHPSSIVEIGRNTEKRYKDLRKLTVSQNPVRSYLPTLVRKTLKRVK